MDQIDYATKPNVAQWQSKASKYVYCYAKKAAKENEKGSVRLSERLQGYPEGREV